MDSHGTSLDTVKKLYEPTITVNPKGIEHYEIDNLCDYDMTTNNYTTPYYRNNCDFFTDYTQNIKNNPTVLRTIYVGLIINFDYKVVIPSLNF